MSKRTKTTLESISFLNALLGYSDPIPDAPVTRINRINDRVNGKSDISQKTGYPNYKKVVLDFILRNPRCGAKQISAGLKIPTASVQTILAKAVVAGILSREALHEKRGCRPIYVYWITDEKSYG